MKRIAPPGGYDCGAKPHIRRCVWATFRRWLRMTGTVAKEADALLMPSIEGTEGEVALANGIRIRRMHFVDRNPAIVAHLQRRFGGVNTYGVDYVRAAERISKTDRRLDLVNLDLCGRVGEVLFQKLVSFRLTGVLNKRACVAVTVLRGREKYKAEGTQRFYQANNPAVLHTEKRLLGEAAASLGRTDIERVSQIAGAFFDARRYIPVLLRCEKYKSTAGNQTMLVSIFDLLPPSIAKVGSDNAGRIASAWLDLYKCLNATQAAAQANLSPSGINWADNAEALKASLLAGSDSINRIKSLVDRSRSA